ncbi:hypothetical protein PM8797T_23184 [Gimesia maris DSM 8797]|nr:hypothetical protein PM8797T_23184 [Gimesia maris DSM 8797]
MLRIIVNSELLMAVFIDVVITTSMKFRQTLFVLKVQTVM